MLRELRLAEARANVTAIRVAHADAFARGVATARGAGWEPRTGKNVMKRSPPARYNCVA